MAELTKRAARPIMVATDLDGSLLDFFTYSWKPALPAIRLWYEQRVGGPVTIVGLGDSPNDIPLFEASDIRFLVKRHGGSYDPTVRRAIRTHLAGDIGPAGWNRAIMKLLGGD